MATKRNYNEPDNFGVLYDNVYSDVQKLNTFTPASDYLLEYIILEGKRIGNCISVDVDIYKAGDDHKPTEDSLVTVQVLQAAIDTTEAEITFTLLSSISLTSGQEYVVVVSCAGADSSNCFRWSYGFSNTGYVGSSTDGGSTWTGIINTQGDWFQAWGIDALTEVTLAAQNGISRLIAIGNDELWYEDI